MENIGWIVIRERGACGAWRDPGEGGVGARARICLGAAFVRWSIANSCDRSVIFLSVDDKGLDASSFP